MDWLNEHVGLVVLIATVILVILICIAISMVYSLRKKIAVQKPNFLDFYSIDFETRERYAALTIGNRSLNEVAIAELGVLNGKKSIPLTAKFKQKKNIAPDVRIVIEQRSSISFRLTEKELKDLLVPGKKGPELKTLRLYCVDLTGTLYKGKIKFVRKLLHEILNPGKAQTEHGGKVPEELLPVAPAAPEEPEAPAVSASAPEASVPVAEPAASPADPATPEAPAVIPEHEKK